MAHVFCGDMARPLVVTAVLVSVLAGWGSGVVKGSAVLKDIHHC